MIKKIEIGKPINRKLRLSFFNLVEFINNLSIYYNDLLIVLFSNIFFYNSLDIFNLYLIFYDDYYDKIL